jgi:DNA-binding SARP family transcriptional activator/tetratricopeptide (TPR) repeat protein
MTAEAREDVSVQLMGPLTAVVSGRRLSGRELGSRKARTVLGVLAAAGDAHVPADRLVEAAWPERPPARPGAELAILVSRLRSALGTASISGGRAAYRLERSLVTVDVDEAARFVAEAEGRQSEPAIALAAATGALAVLDRGDVVDDDPYAAWAEDVRIRVTALRRRARLALATSALATGDAPTARRFAELALATDRLDEEACRLLMRAAVATGEDAVALAAYEQLRQGLAESLGADPSPATREVHLAVLQGSELPAVAVAPAPPRSTTLVGRDPEIAAVSAAWERAVLGEASLLVICGEPGIGKTTLAVETTRLAHGALVLKARCFEAERSLFLQPVVEAIGGCISGLSGAVFGDVVVERAEVLAGLVPEVAAVRPATHSAAVSSPDVGRRQAYDAVTGFLRRLARHQPLVLLIDDLHTAGLATVDLLHYLVRTLSDSRLLLIATVRSDEGAETIARLAPVSSVLELAPLDVAAVTSLVAAAGQGQHLPAILASTSGHPLFVVETLGGLASGEVGIPPSLQDSVLSHVSRQGRETESLLRAAAVLGATFDPTDLAALTGESVPAVTRTCEDALRARLLTVTGRSYAFSYDVTREVLYRTTPEPSRVAYHLRAADLMTDRHEALAAHAAAAGDLVRAARAWLLAGEEALRRFAAADAERLLDAAVAALAGLNQPELAGRCYLARGLTREGMTAWPEALADYAVAVGLARDSGDLRLEMTALVELGGDSLAALGQPVAECAGYLEQARTIARRLGDRPSEATILSRTAILACNDLDFAVGTDLAEQGVIVARASGDEAALAAALDGLKTARAYLGDSAGLRPVIDELMPLVRRQHDLKRLQWTTFESSFLPLARGDWAAARGLVEEALALSRSRGSIAYETWFLAYLGYYARLQGRPDDAMAHGRRSMEAAGRTEPAHAWCRAIAAVSFGTTLLRTGRADEAADVLLGSVHTAPAGHASAYRARFMAAIAEATGDGAALDEAEALLSAVTVPTGGGWLLGWDAYVSVALAQAAAGDPGRARQTLLPVLDAARRVSWAPVLTEGEGLLRTLENSADRVGQSISASRAAARPAPSVSTGR